MNIDEVQSSVEMLAITIASYYSALIRNGVPEALACELTEKFQLEQLKASMNRASVESLKSLFKKDQ